MMNLLVAGGTQSYEVCVCVIPESAPRHDVMNLELTQRSASLAAPAVALQYLTPELPIHIGAELWPPRAPIHEVLRICSRNSIF
jgi:hypothetical protein